MQNLPFNEVYQSKPNQFLSKVKTALKIITSKSSIVIIGKEVELYNIGKTDTINSCTKLVNTLSNIRHHEAVISATVNELISN